MKREIPIIGQEAVCPDGLGRVIDYDFAGTVEWIQVTTYIRDRQCKWDRSNVHLIPLNGYPNTLR